MTLILGMSNPEGIYMSIDYRVTNSRTGAVIDDAAPKLLAMHYPPHEGGPRALLGYTGLAVMPDGTRTGDWLRETMRGDSEEDFDDSMAHLRARLDRDFGPLGYELMINVLVTHGNRRYVGGMSNVIRDSFGAARVIRRFEYVLRELADWHLFTNGSGGHLVRSRGYGDRIQLLLGTRPARVQDFMNLLATVNRDVAREAQSVSPFCHVAFVPAEGDAFQPTSRDFVKLGESVPFSMPLIVLGIDMQPDTTRFHKQFAAFLAGDRTEDIPPIDLSDIDVSRRR